MPPVGAARGASTAPDLDQCLAVLEATPGTLRALLGGLPDAWTGCDEGGDSWSAYDVVGHLIHGERADWIPRARLILTEGDARPFEPFDRRAQERESVGKDLAALLAEFAALRRASLATLRSWDLGPDDLRRPGRHPDLGPCTLGQLLATWVVHDLGHLRQIARVMAKRCADEVGPWRAYLPVLGEGPSGS